MKFWREKEMRFLCHPYKVHHFRLSLKIRFTAAILILLALTEHGLFLGNSAYNQYKSVEKCNRTIDLSYFLENQFPFIFGRIKFNLALGLFVEIMNLSYTFGWNYMELFTMMVSIGLFTRFGQINDRLDAVKGKVSFAFWMIKEIVWKDSSLQVLSEKFWSEIRTDYVILCELMERVDYELRFLILLSNLNNLYFICFQLLNIYE